MVKQKLIESVMEVGGMNLQVLSADVVLQGKVVAIISVSRWKIWTSRWER